MVHDVVRNDREVFSVPALVYDFEWIVSHKISHVHKSSPWRVSAD